jgi:hypothetical protein
VLELGTQGHPAAEAGNPWDTGVVRLGLVIGNFPISPGPVDVAQLGRKLGQQRGPHLRARSDAQRPRRPPPDSRADASLRTCGELLED